MTVEQLAKSLDNLISPELSEPWDNDGIDVLPQKDTEVTRVLCALDCTSVAIEIAKQQGCNVIVTHHPLVFKPLGEISYTDSVGKRVIECIKNGIAVISFHTRLDIIENGVNDTLASILGLQNVENFIPYGRIGDVEMQTFTEFAEKVAHALKLDVNAIPMVKASDTVSRVAVVSGSGKDEIGAVLDAGADTFVTGEVMHNHMIDCKELGLNLICGTHYATERIIVPILAETVGKFVPCDIYQFVREEEYGI
ncbi:MAG: Nif3-like dinuclear metal center hexameric protein [Clostridia bacterium]|nr:Nif3-like dinuclear metal center hexameric protein [Clostridia bacterium]